MNYEVDQKVQLCNIPWDSTDAHYNGAIVTVVALPGWQARVPKGYGIRLANGQVRPAEPQNLKVVEPVRVRGEREVKIAWEEFEKQTGLSAESIKRGPATAT